MCKGGNRQWYDEEPGGRKGGSGTQRRVAESAVLKKGGQHPMEKRKVRQGRKREKDVRTRIFVSVFVEETNIMIPNKPRRGGRTLLR